MLSAASRYDLESFDSLQLSVFVLCSRINKDVVDKDHDKLVQVGLHIPLIISIKTAGAL